MAGAVLVQSECAQLDEPWLYDRRDRARSRRVRDRLERTNFGIVHVRTDGALALAFTHSGKAGVNEGYAFDVNAAHKVSSSRPWRR